MKGPRRAPLLVAGVGLTPPVADDPRSIPEIVLEAVEAALADADVTLDAVDAVTTCSVDLYDGLTAANIAITEVVGAVMKPETRIAADGLAALVHACSQLWAGAYGAVLVVAHGKPSMADHRGLTAWAMDPIVLQPLGVDFLTCAALQAQALAAQDRDAERRWADTAAARRNAVGSGAEAPRTAEDVLRSPMVASPLRRDMCAPLADGACAVVLRRRAAQRGDVVVTGVGHDLAEHGLGDRPLTAWSGLARAFARARAVAGLDGPDATFAVAEPACFYAHEEDLFLTATGITRATALSPTGGLFGGAVPAAAGLGRLIAARDWLRGRAAGSRGLAHGAWGPAGQGQAVALLEAA